MIADLFLRTYKGDYQWLPYLFRSLNRYARGWRTLHVVFPEGQPAPQVPELVAPEFCSSVEYHTCPVYANDYLGQQITKLRAWEWSDADVIGYLDSDLVFTRPFVPRRTGLVEAREWADVGDAVCWREPTADLLGWVPPYETMSRHPFIYPREVVKACYEHVGGEASLLGYGKHFSEFNLLGNFALAKHGFHPAPPTGPDLCQQFRSWDGVTGEAEEWLALNGYAEHVPSHELECANGIWTLAKDTHVSRWVREAGRLDHDQNALPRILGAFADAKVVWDVGAFIGDHTEAYAAGGRKVVAIEPRADAFECLARNFAEADNVTCLCLAVGNEECATLVSDDENKGARALRVVDGGAETTTLDDLAGVLPDEPQAIKMDIEGWEVKALTGARALLSSVRPVLCVEVNRGALVRAGDSPEALHALLTAFGYESRDIYTGEVWNVLDSREQFDVIARPKR